LAHASEAPVRETCRAFYFCQLGSGPATGTGGYSSAASAGVMVA